MAYEAVIGLEIHAELSTKSKLFCACPVAFGHPPNSLTCPLCLGLPGALPVLNRGAVAQAVRAILALEGDVALVSHFARKHYFYPDLPKGYQLTQATHPLGRGGKVELDRTGGGDTVRIRHIHLEEDAGKLVYPTAKRGRFAPQEAALVDYNRAGVPLLEIVTEPDIRNPEEAQNLVEEVRGILQYAGVSDGRMEEGSLRVDCNISLRETKSGMSGPRVELKNLGSRRALKQALYYERERQTHRWRQGEPVVAETRHWDEVKERSVPARLKEQSLDYRYFPEPDLPPVTLREEWIARWRRELPELPRQRRRRWREQYSLPLEQAILLTEVRELADLWEEVVRAGVSPGLAVHWTLGELIHQCRLRRRDPRTLPFAPAQLGALLLAIESGEVSGTVGKEALAHMCQHGQDALSWIRERGLKQITEEEQLLGLVDQAYQAEPAAVAAYQAGKTQALDRLVGVIMQRTRGRAPAGRVKELLRRRLAQG